MSYFDSDHPWAVIRVEDRNAHLAVLDRASIDMKIEPFAAFSAERVRSPIKTADLNAWHGHILMIIRDGAATERMKSYADTATTDSRKVSCENR